MQEQIELTPATNVAEERLAIARRALDTGKLDEAAESFRLLLDGPVAAPAHKGMGDVLFRKGRLARAAEEYRLALSLHPDWAEAENNLGNVYRAEGNRDEAEQHYRRALALNPLLSHANNNLGVILAEKGDIREALKSFENALSVERPAPEARRNLGNAFLHLGMAKEAVTEFTRALEANAQDVDALVGMARALRIDGRPAEAFALAQKALEMRPGSADAYLEAGEAALALNKHEDALTYCRQAVEASPANAQAHEALGSALALYGVPQEAEFHLRRSLELLPNSASVCAKLGMILEQQERFKDAEEQYKAALAAQADHVMALNRWANLLLKQKKPAEALAQFERVRQLQPDSALSYSNIATVLHALGRHEESIEACRKAIDLNANLPEAYQNLGAVQQTLGRLQEARASFERALELRPDLVQTLFSLSNLEAGSATEPMIANIHALLKSEKLDNSARSQLHFALVRIYDQRGEHDLAFKAAVDGNNIEMRRQEYQSDALERFSESLRQTFTKEFFKSRPSYGVSSDEPIFIVGMPRSGSTLVEQILASHSQVFGAGELAFIASLTADLRRWGRPSREFPEGIADLKEPEILRMAGAYRRYTRNLAGSAKRVTDKMPSNVFYLGVIALLFPQAKVIYCQRDALDLFISNYFMLFRNPIAYKTTQKSFAHFYNLQEELMAHWRSVLPIQIHQLKYENLVENQNAETRALLRYCGLEWEPKCLEFHLTDRPILTGSDTQVRRPLYNTSVGRAKPYMRYLRELQDALAGAQV